jgi:hypothetical protein
MSNITVSLHLQRDAGGQDEESGTFAPSQRLDNANFHTINWSYYMNFRGILVGLGLLGTLGTGCIVEVVRSPYDSCTTGDACSGATRCLPATFTSNDGAASLCSAVCQVGEQCPPSSWGTGLPPTCVVRVGDRTGLCHDTCVTNFDCGVGTICKPIAGTTVSVCMPIGNGTAPVSCGASGQTCCAGGTCNAGLACGAGNVCGVPCGGPGQACCAGNACAAGLACGTGNVCGVPCGGAGQACCAGNACTGGLGCNSASVCAAANRTPYAKCVATMDVCGGGTTCSLSTAQSAGKSRGSFCTALCGSAGDTVCPGYLPGAAMQTVVCANLTGNVAEAQCFRRCTSQNDCAGDATTCTSFPVATGALQICVPVGPRI